MWVVWCVETGYADEEGRFATRAEAQAYVDANEDTEFGYTYAMRYEP